MVSERTIQLYTFGQALGSGESLITTVHQFDRSTLLFGSFPSGLHVMDIRNRSPIVHSIELPKAPSAGQATPLCIRKQGAGETEFLVCGRFPSVLLYDLRHGVRGVGVIYSGADSLSSLAIASPNTVIAGGSYRGYDCFRQSINRVVGRGSIELINTKTLSLEAKNRWTASRAAILGVACRNSGVFAVGGSGTLRLLDGVQNGIRDVEIDRMITRIEVETTLLSGYDNVAGRVYLGCAADGLACVEFGRSLEIDDDEEEQELYQSRFARSLLAGEYSDRHFLGRIFS